jgi:hypothetical protein
MRSGRKQPTPSWFVRHDSQQQQFAAGALSLDTLIRGFVRERLAYRFVISADGTEAFKLVAGYSPPAQQAIRFSGGR